MAEKSAVYNSVQTAKIGEREKRESRKSDRWYGGEIVLRKKAATAMPRERFNYLSPGSQARDSTVFVFLL